MKKYILFIAFFAALIIAAWKGKPDIVSTEMIRVNSIADLQGIPATTADILLCVDVAVTVANGTLNMPASPINGQTIAVTTRSQITNVTLNSAIPISGSIATLAAGATVSYVYNQEANRWFRNP